MADVSPELLERIRGEFSWRIETDARINELFEQTNGFSTASRAMDDYAQRCGEILAEVFEQELSSDVLPDGRMYWNIAENVVNPMLANNYELVTQACSQAITTLNEHAGIGIQPIVPEMNRDRIRGIDNLLANAERYDDVAPKFLEAVVNYSQSVATDAVRENADFQYRAGMSPKIIREAEAGACEWCQGLAGTYDYSKVRDTGNDVYRRHENCRCRVMYEPHRGSGRQDVHSKRWESSVTTQEREEVAERQWRRQYGSEQYRRLTEWGYEYNRDHGITTSMPVEGMEQNHVEKSLAATISRQEMETINWRITQAKMVLGITETCDIPMVIVAPSEFRSDDALAAYSPSENAIFLSANLYRQGFDLARMQSSYACPENPLSSVVHEMYHWSDAENYRQQFGEANQEEYRAYMNQEARRAITEMGIDLSNAEEISRYGQYAVRSWLDNNYEELYTEIRVTQLLSGGGLI